MLNENEKSKLMTEYQMLSKRYQSMVIDENKEIKFKLPEEAAKIRERMWELVDQIIELEQGAK